MTKTASGAGAPDSALKAPAAARALPALAARAREESWSYEHFAEALLSTKVSERDGMAGKPHQSRPIPARRGLEPVNATPTQSDVQLPYADIGEELRIAPALHSDGNAVRLCCKLISETAPPKPLT